MELLQHPRMNGVETDPSVSSGPFRLTESGWSARAGCDDSVMTD